MYNINYIYRPFVWLFQFHPLGDYGIAAVHKDELMHEQELKWVTTGLL